MSEETEEKIDWLDELHNSSESLLYISDYLQKLADSFYVTGNVPISKKLTHMSMSLMDISKNVSNSAGKIVNEMLKTSQKNSAAVFNAVLAGIKVATDDKDKNKNKGKKKVQTSTQGGCE